MVNRASVRPLPPGPISLSHREVLHMKIHRSVTIDRVFEAVKRQHSSLDNPGFCVACGEEADGCEPDAERYECECCGKRAVYGAEQLMFAIGG